MMELRHVDFRQVPVLNIRPIHLSLLPQTTKK